MRGYHNSLRNDLRVARVPASAASIRREKPTTSVMTTAASDLVSTLSVTAPAPQSARDSHLKRFAAQQTRQGAHGAPRVPHQEAFERPGAVDRR